MLDGGKLGMKSGVFKMDRASIEGEVDSNRPGNYALGENDNYLGFSVKYIGRSDTDLRERLLSHLNDEKRYPHFKYTYAENEVDAYQRECKNYHDFGGR